MVFDKIKDALAPKNDEKYEVLYYKYSKLKLDKDKLNAKHQNQVNEYKDGLQKKVANHLISLYEKIEIAKMDSFKVSASDREIQRLLMDINAIEKGMKDIFKDFSIEEVTPDERFFDPELHQVASYEEANGMAKGLLLKTVKKGFKYRGEIIKKPKVLVTK